MNRLIKVGEAPGSIQFQDQSSAGYAHFFVGNVGFSTCVVEFYDFSYVEIDSIYGVLNRNDL